MRVLIDGVEYAPTSEVGPRIGVGIKTRNRPEVASKTIERWRERMPANSVLIVVDDASDKPIDGADFRFEENVGIAVASNKCLELLHRAGVEHFFLSDDDAWPISDEWWKPYVGSKEPHLMAIYDRPKGATGSQMQVLYDGPDFIAYHATRGYLLYAERRVIDRVGGMDPAFGKWGWEHPSWSDRIHAAGLTTSRYMDVHGSDKLIYSMDRECEIASTATTADREFSEGPGFEHRMASRHSDAYIEFRELDDVVLTCMLTEQNDPQRGNRMQVTPTSLKPLARSIPDHARAVMLSTSNISLSPFEAVQVSQQINPYFERWIAYYRWLREHPEVGRVWCVDATDVTVTRDPFPEMEPGALYFGYEPTTLRDEWMLKSHPDGALQSFMKANPNLPLLNMGVVGGERDTVMRFAHALGKFYFDDHIDHILDWEHGRAGIGDMAAGNYVARTQFGDIVSTGPHVTNVFKSKIGVTNAWFAHKAI